MDEITAEMWPGVPVVPTMGVSTTDSRRFRAAGIPMYGVSGLFVDPEKTGVHGLNENIGVAELLKGREFLYRLIRKLASE
ncbi:M20/M25/M40 family metallo-hydrolase [Xylophilus rhododendri]|uniref:M20/M25/M40 family metallo-hydrolase n=1 Tax=Xylophilus rhododendri TaxID=2697032 RepID=UPI002DD8C64C|nr:M20/M25/M40 family metallo-hydrolase [Xylophilus rhododendri]